MIEAHPLSWLFSVPHCGNFAVDSDQAVVAGIMDIVLNKRLAQLLQEGNLLDFRFHKAAKFHVLPNCEHEENLEAWLSVYRFDGPSDSGEKGLSTLHIAALEGNLSIMQQLVVGGMDVNTLTSAKVPNLFAAQGMTPLMFAAQYVPVPKTNLAACRTLLELRADPLLNDASKRQAIHCAAFSSHGADSIKLLAEARANVDAEDSNLETPLNVALWRAQSSTLSVSVSENIRTLLNLRADPRHVDSTGNFPLGQSVYASGEDVSLLLEAHADVNQQIVPTTKLKVGAFLVHFLHRFIKIDLVSRILLPQMAGMTALHMNAAVVNAPAMEVLLAARADANIKNAQGSTALDMHAIANPSKDETVVRLLSQAQVQELPDEVEL
eukprot:TRINITY_DN92585_c0_g1_i1.p1 TRINITY_DN92585_c0_g1~~TRINITY_DN92585_c0_g1_i1.p1  ORF type:complete len:380 (+),score=65.24 TRINITY_DN92585_c0_g1_i1:697-1836(+)